jgi:DNA-binding MarR family transcriptional regulator
MDPLTASLPSRDECYCFALRQASRHITQLYEHRLAQSGLTAAQFTILAKLARHPGITALDLADSMVMDRTTLVRALKPLQRDGYVGQMAAEHDARSHVFSLTQKGEHKLKEASSAWRTAQDEFETQFGKGRAASLRQELFNLTETASV